MLMLRGLSLSALRDEERENAIAVFGLDALGIDLDRHGQRAIEGSRQPLTAMQAYLLGIGDVLLAGDADRLVLGLDLKVGFIDARQLDDCDQVVALLEDIDGRESSGPCGCAAQPIAFQPGFQCPLKIKQRVESVRTSDHATLLQ